MTIKPLQPYQQRVVAERDELVLKCQKLCEFTRSNTFKTVDPDEQVRLHRQLSLQQQLIDTLNERIAAF